MNLSGRNLTDYMRKLLMGAGYMFQTSAELEIVKDIKEKITYVAENVAEEGRKRDGKSKESTSWLPGPSVRGGLDVMAGFNSGITFRHKLCSITSLWELFLFQKIGNDSVNHADSGDVTTFVDRPTQF